MAWCHQAKSHYLSQSVAKPLTEAKVYQVMSTWPLGMHFCEIVFKNTFFMPPPLGAGGIMFSGCPSVRPKPEIPSFDLYISLLVHPTNRDRFMACPAVCPSREVSGHLPENAWREWPEILHSGVSWPYSEVISLWPQSVDFSNFGTIST